MASEVGFDAQTPSLPPGGGAVGGLGETFTPDLATGTGTFDLPLDLPNGPNDIGPRLRLRYDTGSPNGPFGMGWTLPLPRLMRSVVHGFPRYDGTDTLVLEGAGELLALPGGEFRPLVDAGVWRVRADGDGFLLTDRSGLQYALGTSGPARLSDPADPARVFAWHVERIDDALGNTVTLSWRRDDAQLYLDRVEYGAYEVVFAYEPRPDRLWWGRGGFLVKTGLRAEGVDLRLPADAQPLLRRWALGYDQAPGSGVSLLSRVTLTGHDRTGTVLAAPTLQLGYTTAKRRDLRRFSAPAGLAGPARLDEPGRRVELVDWTGDGLPDVLEVVPGGRSRLWPNAGDCAWGSPVTLGPLPAVGAPGRQVVLADMNGDGTADLLVTDRRLRGYLPRSAGGLLAREVAWDQAPVVPSRGAQFADLDGDGALDLLTSSAAGLVLHLRGAADDWAAPPRVVPAGDAPPVDLADPHVRLADMTGDGTADLVRVDGGGVTYWPYLGNGRWGAAVRMADPPRLPAGVRPDELFLDDLDGDGCADLVHIAGGVVRWWLNRSGNGFSPPAEVRNLPTGAMRPARIADMTGAGTAGVVWSSIGPGARGAAYFYLDLHGGANPNLLERIDNGVGLTTTVRYTTSAREAARDRAAGRRWTTTLPVPITVVAQITEADAPTGRTSTRRLRYHDGRYDGVLREFAGFAEVTEDAIGDAVAPTLRTVTTFEVGLRADGSEPRTAEARRRRRAVRGRIVRQEHFGLDGSPEESRPYDRLAQAWDVEAVPVSGGQLSFRPRLVWSRRETLERHSAPAAVLTTTNLAWDAEGNVVDSEQRSEAPGDPAQTLVLRTRTSFATDPAGRFAGRIWRVQQSDAASTLLSDTVTEYDGAPEGTVGAQGLVTRRLSLVLTDGLVTDVYGAAPPDFAALGYVRRPGVDGWWAEQGRWERTDDAGGLRGRAIAGDGSTTTFVFDANRTYPETVTDPRGNAVTSEHDYRACRVRRVTDASGAAFEASYDALSRPVALVEPGDTGALPSMTYAYGTASLPVSSIMRRRPVVGAAATIDERRCYDGTGLLLETRVVDDAGEVVAESLVYGARGVVARRHLPRRAASAAYMVPGPDWPATSYSYDALGRLVRQDNADGGVRTVVYGPGTEEVADPEDNRAGGPHAGTPTLHRLDPTGRVAQIVQSIDGRQVTSSYRYDVKGDLVQHTDALGNVVRIRYDLLGRTVAVDRPEHSTRTVYDARGNAVAALGPTGVLAERDFDECRRPVAVRLGGATTPAARFTYHDNGAPAPPDAGARTAGGRLVRIDDEAGVTTFDYDPRGRATTKRVRPTGGATTFQIDVELRADDTLAAVTYPDGSDRAGGRLTVRYDYDRRGLVRRIPGLVDRVEHDVAGRRTLVRYVNGVEHRATLDELTGRLTGLHAVGPAGVLVSTSPTYDLVGNVLRVDSPDPARAATYEYDALYRLVAATTDSGEASTYRYNDAGDMTFKSDVGDYRYGEGGAPATCLTSAGTGTFAYTALGEMAATPWGIQSWDPAGRLMRIDGLPGGGAVDYRYDYAGHRAAAAGTAAGTPVDRLTPDPFFSVEAGALVLHLFDGMGIAALRRASTGATAFLHPDHLGGVAAVTDATGALVEAIRYDPYGAVRSRVGPGGEPAVTPSFTGADFDAWSGLLYLGARFYNPVLGRFVSPDTVVRNVFDPIAWSPYTYCASNPVSYVDPSGHSWWEIALAVVAIVAVVAITIVTFGVGAALLAVAIGIVAGGVVGGLAAAQKGGDFEDIVTGALVGAAVGGWAAFGSLYAGGAVAGLIGQQGTLVGAIVAGGVNGTINGAAMGFAAGYAGGLGSLDEVWSKMWQGALVGFVAGATIGGLAHAISPPTKSLPGTVRDAYRVDPSEVPPPAQPSPGGGAPPGPLVAPERVSELGAVQQVGTGLVGKGAGAAGTWVGKTLLTTAATRIAVQVLVVDAAAGAWDLGYVPWILEKIGVVEVGS